jgi:hypothetical protein
MLRHGRQLSLAEIGVAGQARIQAARVVVAFGGLAGQVAVRYLAGAGVGCLCVSDEDLASAARSVDATVRVDVNPALSDSPEEDPYGFRDPVARDIALGARHALHALRSAIGMTP